MSDIHHQVALVTGASSGIVQAVARELLHRGWNVAGVSRRTGTIENSRYSHLCLDLADLAGLATSVDGKLGHLVSDVTVGRFALVNNAADPGLLGTVDQINPAEMLRIYAINVAAPTWLMGWLVRRSSPEVTKRIVNVSTGAAVDPYPGLGAYGNTKAALRMAGMVFAAEMDSPGSPFGPDSDISILSYEPGVVDTAMQATVRSAPVETLPIAGFFSQLKTDGLLVPPSGPANQIADYLEDDGHPRFSERRFEPAPDSHTDQR